MFGNGTKKENGKSKGSNIMPSNSHSLNSLVKGSMVEGTVKSANDIRVDGTINGKLVCDAKVIIGPSGRVNGEVHCKNAVVEGTFEGIITVSELLNIRENANVSGEVTTNKLIVQSGATFNVTCNMGSTKPGVVNRSQKGGSAEQAKARNEVVKAGKAAGGA